MQKLYTYILRNWEEIIVAIPLLSLIFIAPVIVNYAILPLGYEIPKVVFINLLILIAAFVAMLRFRPSQLRKINVSELSLLAVLILSLLIATHFSVDRDIAIWGNPHRYQGLVFHLLLALLLLFIPGLLSRKNFLLSLCGFWVAGLIQSLIAIGQFVNLASTDPDSLSAGMYINGTFGQANFFAGFIVTSIFMTLILYASIQKSLPKIPRFIKSLIFCSLISMIISLLMSLSIGSILILLAFTPLMLLGYLGKSKRVMVIALVLTLLGILISGFIIIQNDFRWLIWDAGIKYTFETSPWTGVGLDNQYHAFQDYFPEVVVDRSHNVVVDILVTTGMLGVIALAIFTAYHLKHIVVDYLTGDRVLQLFAIAMIISILRLLIYTASAVNLIDLVIIFGLMNWYRSNSLEPKTS